MSYATYLYKNRKFQIRRKLNCILRAAQMRHVINFSSQGQRSRSNVTKIKLLLEFTITNIEILLPSHINFWSAVFTALHWMQGGIVRKKLSVCPSVCLSNAWIVTKRKDLSRFLCHTKDHLA